ncbi:MAG: butyrate kinase [Holophagaceae bacterium]|nr:butyrate kinase [Holophagaceae bacterium]
MFNIEASFDQQIVETNRGRPTVIFTEALDIRVIEAVCYLTRFIRPILLASQTDVSAVLSCSKSNLDEDRVAYAFSECAFIDISKHTKLAEEYADLLVKRLRELGEEIDRDEALHRVKHPTWFALMAVHAGHADSVVGGAQLDPKDYFRPMIMLLHDTDVAVEAGIIVFPDDDPHPLFPHNVLVLGDAGVNTSMDAKTLAEVAVGTCVIARDIFPESFLPTINGAMLSYSHHGSDEGLGADCVQQAIQLLPKVLAKRVQTDTRYSTVEIQGGVKVSAALNKRSAMYFQDMGLDFCPNVLVCPNLDTGNLLFYLFATQFPSAKKFAAIFGVGFRGMSLAKDCTAEDIRLTVKANTLRIHRHGAWQRTPVDIYFKRYKILSINPGSTSTKIAVYDGDIELFAQEIQHSQEELAPFEGKPITAQFQFRKKAIDQFLATNGLSATDLDAVSGRGGLLHPMPHGTFYVNDKMVEDLKTGVLGEHASNLGGLIARDLVGDSGKPAFIVDPVVVDETADRVKITGIKAIRRKVISHALNQIATARRYADDNETFYERLNLIVCHMGGGISIGAHKKGRIIDANDALDGEGPFTPQRSGSLPVGAFLKLIISEKYNVDELRQLIKGKGGLTDLLGTPNLMELEKRYRSGDVNVKSILDAQGYQIAKWICSMLPAFDGEPVDQVLLTGGMARAGFLVNEIRRLLISFGCKITVYPGENEMLALAKGALRVLSGKEEAKEYAPTVME